MLMKFLSFFAWSDIKVEESSATVVITIESFFVTNG